MIGRIGGAVGPSNPVDPGKPPEPPEFISRGLNKQFYIIRKSIPNTSYASFARPLPDKKFNKRGFVSFGIEVNIGTFREEGLKGVKKSFKLMSTPFFTNFESIVAFALLDGANIGVVPT